MSTAQLYTFWISHFSEKARWALSFEGVPFEERALLPGPHALTIRRLAPRTEVPVLVHRGEVIQGSRAILDAIPRVFGRHRLQPWSRTGRGRELERRSHELEELADRSIGRALQAYGYHHLLGDRKSVVEAWSYRAPWWAPIFYRVTYGVLSGALRRGYCRNPTHVEQSRDRLLEAMDQTDAILEASPYLLGDEPMRADVAVCALLSPLVRPKEHPLPWPIYPDPLERFCQELKPRRTFRFVERMYREHRGVPVSGAR